MKKYSMETTVGIFVTIGLLLISYMTLKFGEVSFFGDDSYSLYARFTSVSGLRAGSPVEMLGLEVGKVAKLSIDQENQMALVEMKIKKGFKIYDDAIASIKTSGLIGDKYIQIDPGGSGDLLKPGGAIIETAAPLDIEELIGKYAFGDIKEDKKSDKENAE
ncbi:MAG: outer membrane lipid asymmetry maintenance protein MlaD [Nitrospirae bacterium]|jgi:phospholipid/cholesterol/gamma-HCH transport system substrate-binding protein|nr:outer membrane lipid asymmetry maintenance protein MlaD [Nitrospirota bacterium]